MPNPAVGMVGASIGSSLISGNAQRKAASAQTEAANAGVEENRRQFDQIRASLQPFISKGQESIGQLTPFAEAGAPALQQQQALLGMRGLDEQLNAIKNVEQGGLFQQLVNKGEEAILQRASATGGLRGGNVQAALAQFRPQMLSQAIADQYARLGGLTSLGESTIKNLAQMGQNAAANQATSSLQSTANISGLLQQAGAAQAGGELAQGKSLANMISSPFQMMGLGGGGLISGGGIGGGYNDFYRAITTPGGM